MNGAASFDSTKDFLHVLLKDIQNGKTQLPDFQRGWIWDDEHIRSLLASISLSYPIGAVMMLQTGNPSVRFKPRPVEGAPTPSVNTPERLILDGQQRLTSLFLALMSNQPVPTRDIRNKDIRRWYYVDIAKALDPSVDRDDAIISLPEDKKMRSFRGDVIADYSTPEQEYEAGYFPLAKVFDHKAWEHGYHKWGNSSAEVVERFDSFDETFINAFTHYQLPIIILGRETPKEAVCQVFEKVNTGGVSLNVFELLTATYAIDDFNLRQDWDKRLKRLREQKVLRSLDNTIFLQAVTLVATYMRKQQHPEAAVGCKRKDILNLSLKDYRRWADPVTAGFEEAAKFLFAEKIFADRDLPYTTQVGPLAAIFAVLGQRAANAAVRTRLAHWYWCGVFGELYGSATETRFARDLPDVVEWSKGGPEPLTVTDANFAPTRLLTMRTRNSAAYKGLSAILLRDGAQDFLTGVPMDAQLFFNDPVDIHHIFPRDYCIKQGLDKGRYDCVVNKTPLSASSNRIIGGNAPSSYLATIERRHHIPSAQLDDILMTHVIDPSALRADDFEAFFQARYDLLLERIEKAMGKRIARETDRSALQALESIQIDDEETEQEQSA
jgi:hypothetical protein